MCRRCCSRDAGAVGVEAVSGGETFRVYGERVVLSAGAIRSPQLLMLSGIGPRDQLEQFGIPVCRKRRAWGRACGTT